MFPQTAVWPRIVQQSPAVLNQNPSLCGAGGSIQTDAVAGHCARGYWLDAHGLGGARIWSIADVLQHGEHAKRLTFSGRYTTNWGFVVLYQSIAVDTLEALAAGDVIEAVCDYNLAGAVANIAAISLHITAVWDKDFIGVHSNEYVGGAGVSEAHVARLRTPQFVVPDKLTKLHVSLQVHLVPGKDLVASGELYICFIILRKIRSVNEAENHRSAMSALSISWRGI